MTWTAVQDEFQTIGRNKLVKRPSKRPFPKLGQHKWTKEEDRSKHIDDEPSKKVERVLLPSQHFQSTSEDAKMSEKDSSSVLPRKVGRNKLVFTTTTNNNSFKAIPSPPVPIRSSPRLSNGKNQLVLTKTSKEPSEISQALRKHVRANFKKTKSGLKRVEPPVCKFFQNRGMCFDKDCPYRHVKVGRNNK